VSAEWTVAGGGCRNHDDPPPIVNPGDHDLMVANAVPGFLPSSQGLRFANRFPPQPTIFVRIAGRTVLAAGNAADALCGGLCTVARDRFEAGLPPWDEMDPPPGDSPHFRALVRAQVRSFEFGRVPIRFYDLAAVRPDGPTAWSRLLRRRARAVETVRREWPRVRADIDAGRLSMVGLVRAASWDPRRLGLNHQVIAYGYEASAESLSLSIYDPNHPLDDTVRIRLELTMDRRSATMSYSTGEPLLAFFRAP
jgi:hypothetical protein